MTDRLRSSESGDALSDHDWRVLQDSMARERLTQERKAERDRMQEQERERYNRTRHAHWPGFGGIVAMVIGWWVTCIPIYLIIALPLGGDNLSRLGEVLLPSAYVLAGLVWVFFTFTKRGRLR